MANVTYRKRSNGWEYRFDVGKVDGKRQQLSKGGFRTKAEAIKAGAERFQNYTQTGVIVNNADISVAEYLDYWFSNVCVIENKVSTVNNYYYAINKHLKPRFGTYKLQALTTATIHKWVLDLKSDGYSRHTVSGYLSCLSSAMNYAEITLNYIDRNPCDKVKLPKFERKSDKGHYYIYPETYKAILDLLETKPYFKVAVMIGYHTGMCIGEVFGLTWDDIDFENKTICVSRQIIKRNFGADMRKVAEIKGKKAIKSDWYTQSPKTHAAYRTIYIDDELVSVLRDYKAWQDANKEKYGEYYTTHYFKPETDEKGKTIYRILPVSNSLPIDLETADLVFVKENGEYISTDSFKYASRLIHDDITKEFDFHSLRHTHATILVIEKINPVILQRRLGHDSISTTLEYYTHEIEEMTSEANEQIENLFKGAL